MARHSALRDLKRESSVQRVSVPVTSDVLRQIEARARHAGLSRSAFLARLLEYGLEAEKQKQDQFFDKIRQYRDCDDPDSAEQLGNELGEMIFGR